MSITLGPSLPLTTVNHPVSIPSPLSITPGTLSSLLHCQSSVITVTPHCQLPCVPPLLTVNYPWSLLYTMSVTLGPSSPLPTINHAGYFPSQLSITPGHSHPLFIVNHPFLTITPGPSRPFLKVNNPCLPHWQSPGSLYSSLSIKPGPFPSDYQSHWVHFLLIVHHPGCLLSPLLITSGP